MLCKVSHIVLLTFTEISCNLRRDIFFFVSAAIKVNTGDAYWVFHSQDYPRFKKKRESFFTLFCKSLVDRELEIKVFLDKVCI